MQPSTQLSHRQISGRATANSVSHRKFPVGVLPNNVLHYIEADHLGTPRQVIDRTRNVAVWRWDLINDPFGESAPNTNPDADGTHFVFNMRFPGQIHDAESGLNYNYFRDYDPGVGRYVESDPIGLKGGMSAYGYAGMTPLNSVDRFGLRPYSFSPSVGGGTGYRGFGFFAFMLSVRDPIKGTECHYTVACVGVGASLLASEATVGNYTVVWDDGKECSECDQFTGWGSMGQATAAVGVGISLMNWIDVPNGPRIDYGAGFEIGQIGAGVSYSACYFSH